MPRELRFLDPLRMSHHGLVAARRIAQPSKTYIAYRAAGAGRTVSEAIPFVVTASSFAAAKQRVINEWVLAATKLPHGFMVTFFIRVGDVGSGVTDDNVAQYFKGRAPGDRYVATVDRQAAVHERAPKASAALKKGASFVGYMTMAGQGYRWFLVPEPAYMKARDWVLRIAAKFHALHREAEAEFGMGQQTVPESTPRGGLQRLALRPREALVRFTKVPGRAARWTIVGKLNSYRPNQKRADEQVFVPEVLEWLARDIMDRAET